MTDRLKGCTVAFDHDIRDDDAEALLRAIEMLKGVVSVTGSVATPDDWMNRERVRTEIGGGLERLKKSVAESDFALRGWMTTAWPNVTEESRFDWNDLVVIWREATLWQKARDVAIVQDARHIALVREGEKTGREPDPAP